MNGKMIAMPPFKLFANYASEKVQCYIWVVPYACTIAHIAYNLIWWDPGTMHAITVCLLVIVQYIIDRDYHSAPSCDNYIVTKAISWYKNFN